MSRNNVTNVTKQRDKCHETTWQMSRTNATTVTKERDNCHERTDDCHVSVKTVTKGTWKPSRTNMKTRTNDRENAYEQKWRPSQKYVTAITNERDELHERTWRTSQTNVTTVTKHDSAIIDHRYSAERYNNRLQIRSVGGPSFMTAKKEVWLNLRGSLRKRPPIVLLEIRSEILGVRNNRQERKQGRKS